MSISLSVCKYCTFSPPAAGDASVIAPSFAMHELHHQLGKRGFLWRRLITQPICRRRAGGWLRSRAGPPRTPGMFYSAAGAARTLIYLREGRWEQTPSQPLPSLPLNNLPPSKCVFLSYIFFCGLRSLNILQCIIYPWSTAGWLGVVYMRVGTGI